MQLTTVNCNGCGASLSVPESARFVTCRYCGASLEVKRTESTVYTETLDRIDQRTAAMAEDLGAIRRDTELERLDREWSLRRDALLVRSKNGSVSEPSMTGGLITMFIGGGFGLFWTIMAFSISSRFSGFAGGGGGFPMIFPFFGVLFIVFAVVAGIKGLSNAQRFQSELTEYQRQREALQSRESR